MFPTISKHLPSRPSCLCAFCLSHRHLYLWPQIEGFHFIGKEPHGSRLYLASPNPVAEARQEFTSKPADKARRQGNSTLLIRLSWTQPYQSDRSLSNPSSWKGHRFLDNSLGTIFLYQEFQVYCFQVCIIYRHLDLCILHQSPVKPVLVVKEEMLQTHRNIADFLHGFEGDEELDLLGLDTHQSG